MKGGRGLGVLLLVVGLGLIIVGTVGAAGAFEARPSPIPTQSPLTTPSSNPTAAPSPTPSATPSPTASPIPAPTPEPTVDVEALVGAFFVELQAALRDGRAADMVDALAPAVFERYGREACETQLGGQPAEPGRAFEILAVGAPAAWDYVTDGRSTTIPDAIAVQARVTGPTASGDTTVERELHVQVVDGEVRWFSDCGTPLG